MKIHPRLHRGVRLVAAVLLALPAASRAGAQEYDVSRRVYPFYDNHVDIDVVSSAAGKLQVMRGDPGRIEVAAHAAQGVAASSLSTERSPTLHLTSLGAQTTDYIVVVPERANVRVRLPGRPAWRDADRNPVSRFEWDATPEQPNEPIRLPEPSIDGRYFPVTALKAPPALVRLLGKDRIRSLEIRLEGTEFVVASSRPLTNSPGSLNRLDVDPGQEDVRLMLQIPSYSSSVDVRIGDALVLSVRDGRVTDLCTPAVKQTTPTGHLRLNYEPASGLSCRTP